MEQLSYWHAFILGIIEGLTEFLPVSSTGHLILVIDLLKLSTTPGKSFEVIIQLGAILAICFLYRDKLFSLVKDGIISYSPTRSKEARLFIGTILLAFVPSVIAGVAFYSIIKQLLFSPYVVSWALIVGGILILVIERVGPPTRCDSLEKISWKMALAIGFCQTLAMIPGVSRSGATIMGAYVLGTDRKTATEFSFFLAIPTMFAAATYDIYKNYHLMQFNDSLLIAVGFITAFFMALAAIRFLLSFIASHSFAAFAYYRIVLGSVMLLILYY